MRFAITAEDVATGAVADTFTTLIGLKAANTAGYRARLRSLSVGVSGDAPADRNVAVKIARTDNSGDGTNTAQTPVKLDAASRASIMTGGVDYTAEPTTYESTPLWAFDFNLRGGVLDKAWDAEDAPVWGPDQTLGILAAPRTANAESLTITAEFEEF